MRIAISIAIALTAIGRANAQESVEVGAEPPVEEEQIAVEEEQIAVEEEQIAVEEEEEDIELRTIERETEIEPDLSPSLVRVPSAETPADIAPSRARGTVPWAFEPGMQIFTEYRLSFTENASGVQWFHELDLPRAWAWIGFRVADVVGRVLLEATRAGSEGSLVGVGGDSFVLRLREAWIGFRFFELFELRAGVVPLPASTMLTAVWAMRAIAPIGIRQFGPYELIAPADLGATLSFDVPEGYGRISAAFSNGEGYTSRERNRGKTFELTAQIHPLTFVSALAPLTATISYQIGSNGTGSARADRFIGGIAWDDPRWALGLEASFVMGIEDRGDREGAMIDAWGRVEPIDVFPLLIAVRFSHFIVDLNDESATSSGSIFNGAVGVRVVDPLRLFLAVESRFAEPRLQSAIPGFERWTARVVVEGNLAGRFEDSF